MTQTAGDAVVETLAAGRVRHVFGLIGSSTLEIFDALHRNDLVEFIGVRDERSGVAMADGYARVLNAPGVFLAGQNGPGVTNVVTTLALAKLAYSPVVVLGGAVSRAHSQRDAFQELDQAALLRPVTKAVLSAPTAARIPEFISAALRIAQTGRKGPVFVELPRDLLAESYDGTIPTTSSPVSRAVDLDACREAAKLIASCRRPVILAGGGVKWSNASEEVASLARDLGAAVLTSAGHRDAVDNRFELFLGQFGPRGSDASRRIVEQADVIIGIGTRFGFNSTFYSEDFIPKSAKLVQFDIDALALGRYFPADVTGVGDAACTAETLKRECDLLGCQPNDAWTEAIAAERNAWLADRRTASEDRTEPIAPQSLLRWLSNAIEPGTIVTVDAGTCGLMAAEAIDFVQPRTLLTPLDFGCLGFAHPAAIGAKIARPDMPVLSISGDGGFGFSVADIATSVEQRANVVSLVLNNDAWGAEKAYQRDFFEERYIGADIQCPRYDRIAEEFGALGIHASTWDEVTSLAPSLSADRPTVVQIEVDPSAVRSFRVDSFKKRVPVTSGAL